MGQKAIIHFLEHWHNRQEAGKSWPLKFLTPERLPIENQDSTSRQTQGTMGNHPRVGEDGGHISRNGDSDGVAGEEGMAEGTAGGGLNNAGDMIEVPMIPAQVEIPRRRLFLESLSKEAGYQKLIMLLDTADVSIVDFIVIELILTKPPARRGGGCSRAPSTHLGTLGILQGSSPRCLPQPERCSIFVKCSFLGEEKTTGSL